MDYGDTIKMLIKGDDGWKVWSTVPDSIPLDEPLKGKRVRIRAEINASKDDPEFGIAKRPRFLGFVVTAGNAYPKNDSR